MCSLQAFIFFVCTLSGLSLSSLSLLQCSSHIVGEFRHSSLRIKQDIKMLMRPKDNPILYHHIDHWLLQALAAEVVASKLWQNQNHFNLQVNLNHNYIMIWVFSIPFNKSSTQPHHWYERLNIATKYSLIYEEYFSIHSYAITLCWRKSCCWWWFQHP